MLTPRLTECKDCVDIPKLVKNIDCKIAELSNNMYNNIVFMLNNSVPFSVLTELLVYKRILQYKYCNPEYAGTCNISQIAFKVTRLTAGCVKKCEDKVVTLNCELSEGSFIELI